MSKANGLTAALASKLGAAFVPILGSLMFGGGSKGSPKKRVLRKRKRKGGRKGRSRTKVQFKMPKNDPSKTREAVLTHGGSISLGSRSGRKLGKRSYRVKQVRQSGIRKYIQGGAYHALAKSGFKSIHVPFNPFRVAMLNQINDEKVDCTGSLAGADAYFASGSTTQLSGNDSLSFRGAKLAYEIKNIGALPARVTVFWVYAKADIALDNVPNQASGQTPHVAYLYEGWKSVVDSTLYNYSSYDQISVTPSTSATSYTTGSVAHCANAITIYDSPFFCRYFKVHKQKEYRMLPGDCLPVVMHYKDKKYTKNVHFRQAEGTGQKVLNKGTGFLMFQIRGEPGYLLTDAPALDMDATGGMSHTTSTVTSTDASIAMTYQFTTGIDIATPNVRGHVLAIQNQGGALPTITEAFGGVGNVAEDYVEEKTAI